MKIILKLFRETFSAVIYGPCLAYIIGFFRKAIISMYLPALFRTAVNLLPKSKLASSHR